MPHGSANGSPLPSEHEIRALSSGIEVGLASNG